MVRATFVGGEAELVFRLGFDRIAIDDTVVVGVGAKDVKVLAQVVKGGYQIGDTVYSQVSIEELPATLVPAEAPRPRNKGGRPRGPQPPPPPEVVETKVVEEPEELTEEAPALGGEEEELGDDAAV